MCEFLCAASWLHASSSPCSSAYCARHDEAQRLVFDEIAPAGCLRAGSTTIDEQFWDLATKKLPSLRGVARARKDKVVKKWSAFKRRLKGKKGCVVPLQECLHGEPAMYGAEGFDTKNGTWMMTKEDVAHAFEHSVESTTATVINTLRAVCSSGADSFDILFAGGLSENDYFRSEVSKLNVPRGSQLTQDIGPSATEGTQAMQRQGASV